ncbi:manganese efflux pump MntP family protein [Clostridium luticellarii]|jgi:putative Mn2+ efflux pump MntP|uniref:Putative manganese efflux pump MntP n=1 Tax=Clostridium luticellarii TaxID=1691940 RepID=A0A2T0BBU6_9CLOT|nr:manganese efflux pump [Clostridium luticellarii]PRR81369.1 manganese efflux pump MntP [Clostridium luticellarii]
MEFYSLFLIALALSLDAFGVSLCIGLNEIITRKNKIQFIISFGFFQFFFAICGAYAGFLFNKYIASVPEVIGGALVLIIGILMLKDGLKSKEECLFIKPEMVIVLGISVSIDALVIGFTTLNDIESNLSVLYSTLFIGMTTFLISLAAFLISRYLRKIHIVSKYADYIGGIILIIFGIKMMFF